MSFFRTEDLKLLLPLAIVVFVLLVGNFVVVFSKCKQCGLRGWDHKPDCTNKGNWE